LNEVGFLVDQPKTGTDAKPKYYPGLYKVGAAYNPDAYFVDLVSNTYSPRNYLVYFMANQAVYRPEAGSNKGLDVHFGMDFSPEAVNTIDRQITGGLIYNGLIPKRSKDAVAFGFVYSHVSEKANIASTLNGFPALGSEKAFEINYLTQVTPWLQWQPVVQIYNDLGGSSIRGNGVVLGFRTKVTF
jgi:porin